MSQAQWPRQVGSRVSRALHSGWGVDDVYGVSTGEALVKLGCRGGIGTGRAPSGFGWREVKRIALVYKPSRALLSWSLDDASRHRWGSEVQREALMFSESHNKEWRGLV